MDVNKIIMEAIGNKNDAEVITEGSQTPPVQDEGTQEQPEEGYNPLNTAIAGAISAGLGAVTFRNKLASLQTK